MRKKIFLWIILLTIAGTVLANSTPTVSQVTASPRMDGSGVVDIYYTLNDADNDKCSITVIVSSDGGNTWTITPLVSALSGDLSDVPPGHRHILWASKSDLPGIFEGNYKVKVTADDGQVPSGMAWVYINNDSGVSGHEGFNGYMSKYEITNAQYAQYLNSAKASDVITVSGGYVVGTSGSHPGQKYYNLAGSGYTFPGVTNGGAARINWTGSSFTVDAGFENHPVTYVSWYGATAFASYYGWRLPTEWEWQAVADYNGSYIYGCGTSINNLKANYWNSNHPYGTTTVGAFGTYGYGMCDMAGNVLEWTSSCYYSDCSSSFRSMRGGSLFSVDSHCMVSYRHYGSPSSLYFNWGFRVCRYTLNDGLVAYYSFDDGKAIDNSGKGNDGTIYGASATSGISGQSLNFDGSNDYVIALTGFSKSNIKTISLWFRVDSDQINDNLYGTRYTPTGGDNDRGLVLKSHQILFTRFDSMDSTIIYNVDYSDANWHHVVTVETETGAELYYDGVLVGSSSRPFNYNLLGTRTIPLGARINNGALEAYFDGKIDEVRVYNRALSASEIQSLYQNP